MSNSYPNYKPLFTGPMKASDEKENKWTSHLKRQARKTARYAIAFVNDDRGGAITVLGNRGDGKSTWINFFVEALNHSTISKGLRREKPQWKVVELSLEQFKAAAPLRPVAYLLYQIAATLKDNELKALSGWVQMDKRSAGQAAIAFATSQDDFVEKYGEMSTKTGSTLPCFAEALKKALLKRNKQKLLIVLDDCDLLGSQRDISALLFTSLYLTERAPVLRVAVTSPNSKSRLLGGEARWMCLEEQGRLLWRMLGEEVSLSPMNSIRKMMFLRWPQPEAKKNEPWGGLLVWSEMLSSENFTKDGGYQIQQDSNQVLRRHKALLLEMVKVVWEKSGKVGATLYYDIIGKDLLNKGDEISALEKKLATLLIDEKRKEYIFAVLELFPSNRRETVLLTNLIIRQREQILNAEQPFDREISWATLPERIIRLLMCIGYTLATDSTWRTALEISPELKKAFQDGAFDIDKERVDETNKLLKGLMEQPEKVGVRLPQATIDEQWKLIKLYSKAVTDLRPKA